MNQNHINSVQKTLIELNALVIAGGYNTQSCQAILKRNKVNISLMTFACDAGVFSRVERGVYKSNLKTIDPIHARKCLEVQEKRQSISNKKLYNSRKKLIKKLELKKVAPPPCGERPEACYYRKAA